MNHVVLGIVLGVAAGLVDLALMTATKFPGGRDVKIGAFTDRFLIGFFTANVTLPLSPLAAGALIGVLCSLPPAVIIREYAKILISGLVLGLLAGYATGILG